MSFQRTDPVTKWASRDPGEALPYSSCFPLASPLLSGARNRGSGRPLHNPPNHVATPSLHPAALPPSRQANRREEHPQTFGNSNLAVRLISSARLGPSIRTRQLQNKVGVDGYNSRKSWSWRESTPELKVKFGACALKFGACDLKTGTHAPFDSGVEWSKLQFNLELVPTTPAVFWSWRSPRWGSKQQQTSRFTIFKHRPNSARTSMPPRGVIVPETKSRRRLRLWPA